jgi:hypothetical protein
VRQKEDTAVEEKEKEKEKMRTKDAAVLTRVVALISGLERSPWGS